MQINALMLNFLGLIEPHHESIPTTKTQYQVHTYIHIYINKEY